MRKKISVIMGVYNAEDTVYEAIDSILVQKYTDWEFIICDDASTDNTYKVLLEYKEKYPHNFIILQNEKNSKLSYSLNKCLENANGYYIARMDADDKSDPMRFEKQIAYLEKNQDIDLVGTSMQRFNEDGLFDIIYAMKNPDKYSLKNRIPFNHATIMTYKRVYDSLNGYTVSKLTNRSQDVDLWFRFFYQGFKGDNLQEPLYLVRENISAIKRRTVKIRINGYRIKIRGFRLLGYPLHWFIKPTIVTIIKILTPFKLQEVYRKYQAK